MEIKKFQEKDRTAVEEIFSQYWTDPEFLKELSEELDLSKEGSLFLVAEESNEIMGIVGFKRLSDYLKEYAVTKNPIEFYVIASKYKGKGIGQKLTLEIIKKAREHGFTEVLLYSPHTHSESWNFYDKSGFEKVGEVTPPDDEIGQLFRKIL